MRDAYMAGVQQRGLWRHPGDTLRENDRGKDSSGGMELELRSWKEEIHAYTGHPVGGPHKPIRSTEEQGQPTRMICEQRNPRKKHGGAADRNHDAYHPSLWAY